MKIVKTIENKHNYNMIDVSRMFFAYVTIALHTNPFVNCDNQLITDIFMFFSDFIVPFFMITAGYFLYISMNKDGVDKIEKVKAYLMKIIKMYLIAEVFSLPLTIYGYIKSGNGIISNILSFIKYIFFVGKLYNSYQLWFLLALIYSVIVVIICLKKNTSEKFILFLGVVSYAFYELMHLLIDNIPNSNVCIDKIAKLYFFVFNYGGIFSGLLYISLGMILAKYKKYLTWWIALSCLIVLTFFEHGAGYLVFEILHPIRTVALFMLLLNVSLAESSIYVFFRKASMLIYLSHLIIMSIYTFLIIGEPNKYGIDTFLITVIGSTIFAVLFIVTQKNIKK